MKDIGTKTLFFLQYIIYLPTQVIYYLYSNLGSNVLSKLIRNELTPYRIFL